jgi:16S rRNA (guanine966-N2)-methyltransferase
VVAGELRGRRLVTPPGRSTRPTADRVREATFNALHSLGAVDGATVLDLFAGSGAMGIEALSRGADHVTFVDDDPGALDAIRANVASTGVAERSTVRRGDARRVDGRFDLVVADPPYAFDDDDWRSLLGGLEADVVVVESDREVPLPAGWSVVRAKRYGTTVVIIARKEGSSPA